MLTLTGGFRREIQALLVLVVASSMAKGSGASVDAAGYSMEILVSASGVLASDPGGHEMFQVVSGPSFAQGVDSNFADAYPLSSDLFVVPVTVSAFTLE